MSTQICPNCKEDAFTWCLDEEVSPLTIWGASSVVISHMKMKHWKESVRFVGQKLKVDCRMMLEHTDGAVDVIQLKKKGKNH